MTNSSLNVLVCYYRDIYIRAQNPGYIPIQCGKDSTGLDLEMIGDNTGQNISVRNKYWSEITGLYWAWKNMREVEYVGLCSYRRFFNFIPDRDCPVKLLRKSDAHQVLNINLNNVAQTFDQYDIILPYPYIYAYSVRRVCSMNYVDSDFDLLERVVQERSPEYWPAFYKCMYSSNKLYGHNMFVLPWKQFQSFCTWVFDILLSIEPLIKPFNYPIHQIRVFGYMHELLLGVFVEHHQMRVYNSQIAWINDDLREFKFNSKIYQSAASLYYHASRLWLGSSYRHKLT